MYGEEDDDELPDDLYLDIDKAWHAIHFLLTGDTWGGEPPLFNAVLGGTELGAEDVGHGPARFLTLAEVQDVASALSEISETDLRNRYNASALSAADIYPGGWEDVEGSLEYLLPYYTKLVEFFSEAAKHGDAMLIYLN